MGARAHDDRTRAGMVDEKVRKGGNYQSCDRRRSSQWTAEVKVTPTSSHSHSHSKVLLETKSFLQQRSPIKFS